MRNFIDIINENIEADGLTEDMKLKMLPDQVRNARGLYAAFIISIQPRDFIELTTHDTKEFQHIYSRKFPLSPEEYKEHMAGLSIENDEGSYQMPFLNVDFPSGKITGHEGRHRAAMLDKNGGKSMPVFIIPKEDTIWRATQEFNDDDWNVLDSMTADFHTESEANHFLLDYHEKK